MKFIHYGCWNNINCIKKTNYRDIIVDYIQNNETDYDYLIISGDNWYSNDSDDAKYYYTNVLRSGLVKLYNLNKKVHIILGNHDEDTETTQIDELKKNCMLHTEMDTILNIDRIAATTKDDELLDILKPSLEYLYATYNSKPVQSKSSSRLLLYKANPQADSWFDERYYILFVFLNTNVFNNDDESVILPYLQSIKNRVSEYPSAKNIIIVGHVPITSKIAKAKNNSQNNIVNNKSIMTNIIELFESIKPTPIYLCADTHNFQILSVDNKFVQVVAGTGGGEPELLDMTMNNKILYELKFDNDNNIPISGYYHDAYGYSIIDIKDDIITVTYKHIINSRYEGSDEKYIFVMKEYQYKIINQTGIQQLQPIIDLPIDVNLRTYLSNSYKSANYICNNLNAKNLIESADGRMKCFEKKIKASKSHIKNTA